MLVMVLKTGWAACTIISILKATQKFRTIIRVHHTWTRISFKWTNFSKLKPMNKSKKREKIRSRERRMLPKIR